MDEKKKPLLFEDFPPLSTSEWEAKIHEDLKGADYEKRLVWKTPEGIDVRPYYRSEDLEALPQSGTLPGEPPFARGNRIKDNDWIIRQDFEEADPAKANALAREAIIKGVEAVGFNAERIDSASALEALLEGIDPEKTAIHLLHGTNYPGLFDHLITVAGQKQLKGSLGFDPLAYLLLYGKFHQSRDLAFERAGELIKKAMDHQKHLHVISISGQHYHNAGASMVQELAYSMSQAAEYLAALSDKGIAVSGIAPRMHFSFAVGSSYFMEIAKLRAARMLWARILDAFMTSADAKDKVRTAESIAAGMFIHCVTSDWNKSIYDPYVNMLRTATEAMSAAIGGADSLCVSAFDDCFRKPGALARRMARNQQIILKHEAHFNKVADPAAGSYYIEKLTGDLAEAAWELFVRTEDEGGFIRAAESGVIRESIEESCRKRDTDIAQRKRVFVGTNQYADTSERMLDKIEPRAKLTDMSVLRQYRGPQAFEALRMAVENHTRKGFETPKVFLFTYGNLTMRKARASFSANFFGVAGYEIIDNNGFTTVDDGVKAALASKAHIVVLCSSDEEYLEMASAASMIKDSAPATRVVVAGNPKEIIDRLNEAGVDHYIHLRTNTLEALTRFNEQLGVL
ncbi:MAG: methylmalonyl-CoA mutase family protein [Bacteroidales bacterium]|nr:methylmalonyl-CoA mutase family protein [Bacteroidales bacterium]